MLTRLKIPRSRREFLSGMCLAAMAAPVITAASPGEAISSQGPSKPLPFNPEGPFDVRLRPVIGHRDYWRQTAHMQSFDRFGRPKFIRNADAYAQREEFREQTADTLWHRVTWKFATEENRDGFGRRLSSTLFPYSKDFSHESPVTGAVWDMRMNVEALPHTVEAFAFLQQPFDIQYVFYLISDSWTGIERLRRIGDTVTAGVNPETLGDNWFTRPTWEFYLDPAVRYWTGEYRLTLSLAGLTKIADDWCARLDFDCIVPERLSLRLGNHVETHHIHAYTMGDIAISLETHRLAHCFWNHFIVDGNEEPPPTPGIADAVAGLRFWRRQILLRRITEEDFIAATPSVAAEVQ
jgi:hypothetical protein